MSKGAASERRGGFKVSFAHVVLIASGMLVMAIAQAVIAHNGRPVSQAPVASPTVSAAAASATPRWGQLHFTPLALNRPLEYFTNTPPNEKPLWVFRGTTPTELRALFNSLDTDANSKGFLLDTNHWEAFSGGFRIAPPPAVVINIKPQSRARFYEFLARTPENTAQRMPFQFRLNGFDEWFSECGLSRDRVETIKKMTYNQAGALCFADAATISQICSPAETMCLIKSLWRVPTFICSVRVDKNSDLDSLVNYWGANGRGKEYRSFLESMARVGDGSDVTISYFLPPFARLRLYTYPDQQDPRAAREDCFWTSMNFSNEKPDDRFLDANEVRRALTEDYITVNSSERQLGDVLLLLSSKGEALHMCVAVADDVVFTKNGFNVAQPWVLMHLNEMLASYEMDKPFEVLTYRRKNARLTSVATR